MLYSLNTPPSILLLTLLQKLPYASIMRSLDLPKNAHSTIPYYPTFPSIIVIIQSIVYTYYYIIYYLIFPA